MISLVPWVGGIHCGIQGLYDIEDNGLSLPHVEDKWALFSHSGNRFKLIFLLDWLPPPSQLYCFKKCFYSNFHANNMSPAHPQRLNDKVIC